MPLGGFASPPLEKKKKEAFLLCILEIWRLRIYKRQLLLPKRPHVPHVADFTDEKVRDAPAITPSGFEPATSEANQAGMPPGIHQIKGIICCHLFPPQVRPTVSEKERAVRNEESGERQRCTGCQSLSRQLVPQLIPSLSENWLFYKVVWCSFIFFQRRLFARGSKGSPLSHSASAGPARSCVSLCCLMGNQFLFSLPLFFLCIIFTWPLRCILLIFTAAICKWERRYLGAGGAMRMRSAARLERTDTSLLQTGAEVE